MRFQHVVQGQCRKTGSRQGFHFHPCWPDGFHGSHNGHCCFMQFKFNIGTVNRQWMTQRNQFIRPLGSQNPCNACRFQRIAFFGIALPQKEENKEAIQFLHDLVANKETPVDQIADKYDQMNPKINDGKYGCWFMWGLGTDYAKADMLGADKIHMAMVPDFSGNGERAIFTDSWNYVLNSASKNKDAAIKFLQYMADEGGMEASYKAFDRYPARKDVAEKVVPDTDPAKEMYSQYAEECNVQGRPLVAQTMEFISDMGTIFQSCMKDEITVDEFCKKAQEVVDTYQ